MRRSFDLVDDEKVSKRTPTSAFVVVTWFSRGRTKTKPIFSNGAKEKKMILFERYDLFILSLS